MTHALHTLSPSQAAEKLEACFNKIWKENMAGIQILNNDLVVEAVEFQQWDERVIGMMVTPWFINLIMLPKEGENWECTKLGEREKFNFPQKECPIMINEIEGFGFCKTYSLYSPVNDFPNPEAARIAAAIFLRDLLDEKKRIEPTYSEEQIQRYLNKEEMVHREELKKQFSEPANMKKEVNRRDLLRGKLREDPPST
ncbi:MAG: [NiFe]-hydrogenase assembly chaperone HybE [Terasakiella sp.]|uniref:[NiFe]-hydrogenase assembly chaperone HybE n=1 Tax=unclassified Terasakiella TaxID=2614952 RepID=UPI003AFFC27B